jgi:hypothetical protein
MNMLTFRTSMDEHSLDIMRGDSEKASDKLGFLQWHPPGPPRIVLFPRMGIISLSSEDIDQIQRKFAEVKSGRRS